MSAGKVLTGLIAIATIVFVLIIASNPIQPQPGPVATIAIPINRENVKVVAMSPNDTAQVIFYGDHPVEVCYKNIKYVYFNNGNASWGSVMFDVNTGHPASC